MKNKKMKTRIIAGMLSMIAVFSVGTASVTTASAAGAPGVTGIAKDLSSFAITQTIDKFVSNSIAGSLLKMGTGYLLDWVFDGKEEKQPTVKDAIEEIGKLRDTVNANHKEEMNSLKVINSNIDTKDFRLEADSIRDDYSNALTMIKRHSDNIGRRRDRRQDIRRIQGDPHRELLQHREPGKELQQDEGICTRRASQHR